ncbi:hypothetical protein DVH05_026813 [Phytophthora capsici]|nr:hypothetical protein DVH05_026813 [Phytophthora capsici]
MVRGGSWIQAVSPPNTTSVAFYPPERSTVRFRTQVSDTSPFRACASEASPSDFITPPTNLVRGGTHFSSPVCVIHSRRPWAHPILSDSAVAAHSDVHRDPSASDAGPLSLLAPGSRHVAPVRTVIAHSDTPSDPSASDAGPSSRQAPGALQVPTIASVDAQSHTLSGPSASDAGPSPQTSGYPELPAVGTVTAFRDTHSGSSASAAGPLRPYAPGDHNVSSVGTDPAQEDTPSDPSVPGSGSSGYAESDGHAAPPDGAVIAQSDVQMRLSQADTGLADHADPNACLPSPAFGLPHRGVAGVRTAAQPTRLPAVIAAFDGGYRVSHDRSAYAWCVWSATHQLLCWGAATFATAQTNNAMEAQGLLACASSIRSEFPQHTAYVFGDSQVIINQALLQHRCHATGLRPWVAALRALSTHCSFVYLHHVRRE